MNMSHIHHQSLGLFYEVWVNRLGGFFVSHPERRICGESWNAEGWEFRISDGHHFANEPSFSKSRHSTRPFAAFPRRRNLQRANVALPIPMTIRRSYR
jgi:hypothetical protein